MIVTGSMGWEDTSDSPERVRIRDINDILDILSIHRIIPHDRRSEDRHRGRRDQGDQSCGLKRTRHGSSRWLLVVIRRVGEQRGLRATSKLYTSETAPELTGDFMVINP